MGIKNPSTSNTIYSLVNSIFIITTAINSVQSRDLYSSSDDVLLLNGTTLNQSLFDQNKDIVFMVQFYNTYCGHCQHFAPIYKELGTRIKGWRDVFRIAGIDCFKDENLEACSNSGIGGYPSVLIYPPNAHLDDPADAPFHLQNTRSIDDLEEGIINYLANLAHSSRPHPPVIDAFEPIQVSDIKDLKQLYPDATKHDDSTGELETKDLMLIVEAKSSYIGRRLMLEYYRIRHKLELRRVTLSNEKLLAQILSRDELEKLPNNQPLLVRVNPSKISSGLGKGDVLVRGELEHVLLSSPESERQDFVVNRFKIFFENFYSIELGNPFEVNSNHPPTERPFANEVHSKDERELEIFYLLHTDPIGGKRIFAVDLLKSIVYMLTHELRLKGNLSISEFGTLRNLLTILRKFLPLEKWDEDVSKFIEELRSRIDGSRSTYERRGITSNEVNQFLEIAGADAIRLKYKNQSWVSCLASDRSTKGYPCSLWLLFHSLTVGEYFKAAPVVSKPNLVLLTMRGYITKFFGCTVCSSNFEKETESLEETLNSRNSSVLWLWNTHNLVNQRLNNEKQHDKKSLDRVIFPVHSKCPQCYLTDLNQIGVDGKTLADIQWNSSHALNYLIGLYRPDRVVTPTELNSLIRKIEGKVNYEMIKASMHDMDGVGQYSALGSDMNRSVEQWNIFSTSDISLCLLLYMFCVIIVAIVCIALNPKWKRYKAKQ